MKAYTLEAFPDTQLHVALYTHVRNPLELRQTLTGDQAPPCTLMDARYVLDMFQVLVAVGCALQHEGAGKLRCKSLHAEILLCMGTSKNVGAALKTFGVKDTASAFLLVTTCAEDDAVKAFAKRICGQEEDIEQVCSHTDQALVASAYKVSMGPNMLGDVCTRIACRDV